MTDQPKHWTADDVLAFLQAHADTLRQMGVREIGLFGSYARGDNAPDSDMDFIFVMDNLTYKRWMAVWNFLEDHLGCEVDLVPEEDLRPELRPYVLPEVRYAEGY